MQKILFAFAFLFFLSSITIAQESSFEKKVAKMLEVSGARQNFDAAILNMVELQKRSFGDEILSSEFFDELGKEMIEVGFEKLAPEFVPIYKKHLTEAELDEIIKFYESEVGQSLVKKTPLIMNEAMQIGAAWGEEIAQEIYERVEAANSKMVTEDKDLDCSAFKEGTFYTILDDDSKVEFKIKGDQLTVKEKGKKKIHTIEWVSDCSYKMVKEDGQTPDIPKEISIIEVNEKSCKIIIKFGDTGEYEEREFFIKK